MHTEGEVVRTDMMKLVVVFVKFAKGSRMIGSYDTPCVCFSLSLCGFLNTKEIMYVCS